jgi:hypothetical protein
LLYSDAVNVLGENMNTVKKKTEALKLYWSLLGGIAINNERSKYMIMTH